MGRVNSPSKADRKAPKAARADARHATKGVQREVAALARSKRARVTTTPGGAETRVATARRGGVETEQVLTTAKPGALLESKLEYSKTTRRSDRVTENSFSAETDVLGRRSSQAHAATTSLTADTRRHTVTTRQNDVYGVETVRREQTVESALPDGRRSATHATITDSEGNRHRSSDVTTVREGPGGVVTRNRREAGGTALETRSHGVFEDGLFSAGGGAEWKAERSVGVSAQRERDIATPGAFARADAIGERAEKALDWLELDPASWSSEVDPSRLTERVLVEGAHGSVRTQVGVTGGQAARFDGRRGVDVAVNREARAGVYAESSGQASGRLGEASYAASAKAEVKASVDGRGRLDTNGLDAVVTARAGASVEAELHGRASTPALTIGGVDVRATVEGHARASAEAVAEATGRVQITRTPPTAIVTGEAGASAVAKVEGELRFSAGPFSVSATGYASAGAEARAASTFGYEDGKLKLGGSLGAALGVGLGGSATVEVDVRQLGQLAKDVADVNDDGKVDLWDGVAALGKTVKFATGWLGGDAPGSGPAAGPAGVGGDRAGGTPAWDGRSMPNPLHYDMQNPASAAQFQRDMATYQQMMNNISLYWQTLSNVLKAQVDTAQVTSRNIR
ncbi:MAG: hypothetical protein INH41_01295 [Myxococcaceae bacterium]|jgi:hypothetical protein|nr:hypothetical protein [Myxococcaceae bacterium]MCA3011013.1 hypothetical protein [Myxococcaceae bacterium]